MNKQFLISAVVMFVATMITGFIVHATLLAPDYAALPNLYRSEEDWHQLMKNTFECDFSWGASARKYVRLYEAVKRGTIKNFDKTDTKRRK